MEKGTCIKLLRVVNLRKFIVLMRQGCCFRLLPNKTLSLKGVPCNGERYSKESSLQCQ
jgi:hypothetical protein